MARGHGGPARRVILVSLCKGQVRAGSREARRRPKSQGPGAASREAARPRRWESRSAAWRPARERRPVSGVAKLKIASPGPAQPQIWPRADTANWLPRRSVEAAGDLVDPLHPAGLPREGL